MDDHRELEPLTTNVLANLTIEELEQRLEMQILQGVEGDICIWHSSCSVLCNQNECTTQCGTQCGNNCPNLCGADFDPCAIEIS